MNKPRRKELAEAVALLMNAKEILEIVQDEEQEAFDNMPEGLQSSERGEKMEEYIYSIEDAANTIDDMIDTLNEIVEG